MRFVTWLKVALLTSAGSVGACVIVYDMGKQHSASASPSRSWPHRVVDAVFPLIVGDDTVYAPRFNERVFQGLELGLSDKAVELKLGPPLEKRPFPDGRLVWYYSDHGSKSQHFHLRMLWFDPGGRLVEKRAQFFMD